MESEVGSTFQSRIYIVFVSQNILVSIMGPNCLEAQY